MKIHGRSPRNVLATVFLLAILVALSAEAQNSGWTVETLKEHVDQLRADDKVIRDLHKEIANLNNQHSQELREAADKRYDQRFQAQESAQMAYKTSSNEFRGTLSDQAGRFVSRSELGGYIMSFVITMGVLAAWVRRKDGTRN